MAGADIAKARARQERAQGLLDLMADMPTNRRGLLVEVGSWLGESADIFAQGFRQVVCVDPWGPAEALEAGCAPWLQNCTIADVFGQFLANVGAVPNLCYLRATGEAASLWFLPGTLDAVYLDADHGYEATRAEILRWLPRLRRGGVMAGHDYGNAAFPGVQQAVDELFNNVHTYQDTSWAVWND